jgi:hypothetical protein
VFSYAGPPNPTIPDRHVVLRVGVRGFTGRTNLRVAGMTDNDVSALLERLDRIEAALAALVERETIKDWYDTDEFARLVGKAEFTVREWCRLGRVNAEKRASGGGRFCAWVVSHDELLRYRREGLLPVRAK